MRPALDFDRGLTRLAAIDDAAMVARVLAPGLPRPSVRRQDTKYEPGVRCVAGYVVRDGGPAESSPVMGAVVVTPTEVVAFPLSQDPRMPGLAQALDGSAIAERLGPVVGLTGAATRWRADPVRYKPGARCMIRYVAETPAGTTVLYGKVYADGSARQAALIEAVRRAAREVDGAPLVPPVVGEWSDLGLLVQPAVNQAVELHGLVASLSARPASRDTAFADAGAAAAALHECWLPDAPNRTFLDDIRELRGYRPAIASVDAAIAARYDELVDTLEAVGPSAEVAAASHGAFRTDQLIAGEEGLVMIDLDTACRSERARDIGNLLAYLDWKAIRRPDLAQMLGTVRDGFLSGYARRLPLPPPTRVAVNRAASMAKIVGRRYRGLSLTEWALVPSLLTAAEHLAAVPQMEPT